MSFEGGPSGYVLLSFFYLFAQKPMSKPSHEVFFMSESQFLQHSSKDSETQHYWNSLLLAFG
jgi:hypothetical protein